MNLDVKKRWIEALRSGDYKQTEGTLNRNDETFCCLGVLCELAVEDGVVTKKYDDMPAGIKDGVVGYRLTEVDFTQDEMFRKYTEYDLLPRSVMAWAGLEAQNPDVEYHDPSSDYSQVTCISSLNDEFHMNFEQIANVIEEQL